MERNCRPADYHRRDPQERAQTPQDIGEKVRRENRVKKHAIDAVKFATQKPDRDKRYTPPCWAMGPVWRALPGRNLGLFPAITESVERQTSPATNLVKLLAAKSIQGVRKALSSCAIPLVGPRDLKQLVVSPPATVESVKKGQFTPWSRRGSAPLKPNKVAYRAGENLQTKTSNRGMRKILRSCARIPVGGPAPARKTSGRLPMFEVSRQRPSHPQLWPIRFVGWSEPDATAVR